MLRHRTPSRQPLFWAAVAFSVGLWLGKHAWRPPSWWIVAIAALVFGGLYYFRRKPSAAKILSLGSWVLLGAFLIQIRTLPTVDPLILRLADGNPIPLTGHVIREGYAQQGPHSIHKSIDLQTEEIAIDGRSTPLHAGVRLSIAAKEDHNSSPSLPPLPYGTRIRLVAKLHPARNYRNPGAFDYEGYLHDSGITALGLVAASDIEPLPEFSGNRIELWRTRIHASIIAKIHQLWPASQASLMDAMVLGEESFLRNSTRNEYQRSGTYHVLVVSGMNLSILAFAIFWFLRQFRLDPAISAIITVLVSFAYAFIVGVGPPVWRAALMLATYLGARLLYRDRNMMNAIGAAALGVLIVDPDALFGASFQLTFLAVFIIAGIGAPFLERTTLPYSSGLRSLCATSYDLHLDPQIAQFRLDLRLIARRLRRFVGDRMSLALPVYFLRFAIAVCNLIFISALMQAGLALLMAYHFHRATTMGMPANLTVIPLIEILMPFAAAAVGLGYISPFLAKPAVWISALALEGIAGTVHLLGGAQVAGASIADLRVAMPTTLMVIASLTALGLAMFTVRYARWYALAAIACLFAVASWIAFFPSHPQIHLGVLEMTIIDVGQGDSILLVTPEGRTILVDAGGLPQWMHSDFDVGEQVVSSYLWNRGIDHLDLVAITHPHADHYGGMPAVIANFHPHELWISVDHPVSELAAVVSQAQRANIMIKVMKEGDELDYGGAHFRVLAPGRDQITGSMRPNDDCLVFTVAFGESTVLLEGDAERPVERRIIGEHPQAMLLKVAHHGSASGTSADLLSVVHPQYAAISVGVRNVYRHPRFEVLQRLQNAGVKTYRTDEDGAVTFYLDGKHVMPEVAMLH